MNNEDHEEIKPWYREPWPWIIIGSLGVVIVACFVTLGLAIWSYDGLVDDDYYKEGLAINKKLERAERSEHLSLNATLIVLPDGTVRLTLDSANTEFKAPLEVRLRMVHARFPDQDRNIVLRRVEGNTFSGEVLPPSEGQWQIILESDDWRLATSAQAPIHEIRISATDS
ncbi:MAG: FixH family protein [Burkholderiales bacterium]|jgi:hypothetical protein|nr:FixH family protein [Burkholderiales bacterium]